MPSLPGGKPFLLNHSRYDTGRSHSKVPLYLPKGILALTSCMSIRGSGPMGSVIILRLYKTVELAVAAMLKISSGIQKGNSTCSAKLLLFLERN